jgi:rhamnogalacturonyl hydrolase YesR
MRPTQGNWLVTIGIFTLLAGCNGQGGGMPDAKVLDARTSQPAAVAHSVREKLSVGQIASTLVTIRNCLDARMVVRSADAVTDEVEQYPPDMLAAPPTEPIGPTGYPAAVIYAGMLSAADATGDAGFTDFVGRRFALFARTIPSDIGGLRPQDLLLYRHWLAPTSLDSCGAMGAAFVKARRAGVGGDLQPLIKRFDTFISQQQFRLQDGTLARNRPQPNSVWADDMYMSVPFLAQMGAMTGDSHYFDDAAKQVTQISARLFVPGLGLYTHGWNAGAGDQQPHYFWTRANGWCSMAMVELLDVLPKDHPQRGRVLQLLQAQAQAIASIQSGSGLWHQMLDRSDSVLETSGSAMFTYAIARGVNRGWLDAGAYGPVAVAGWKAVARQVDSQGHVGGTCEATSYGADYAYYYNRKLGDDQHGYGAVLLAGAEIIRLLKNPDLTIRDEGDKPVSFVHVKN